jgi:glyoxylase-like metal-dependent hydrolase (beta-lactamase superfamily II)
MVLSNKIYEIGDVTVVKVHEQLLTGVDPVWLYPGTKPEEFAQQRGNFSSCDLDQSGRHLTLSIHSWLLRTPNHVILIDTGSGNDKDRARNPAFHHQKLDYLATLAAAGVQPEQVDFVFNTHLHVDHVGWNTVRRGEKWVPTFPNAKYVFPRSEDDYYASPASHNEVNVPSLGVYEDSVMPVVEAGLADRIDSKGGQYLDEFEFVPTPGHSIGHMSIRLRSKGRIAIFGGDVMHHPTQVYRPDLNTVFCEFQDDAKRSRALALDQAADAGALYFATHFPGSSVGQVRRENGGFTWTYR